MRATLGTARDRLARARRRLHDDLRERRASRRFRRRLRGRSATPAPDGSWHVVLVVVDALRADAVTPDHAPFLAGLDGGAAVSPSTWTTPAVTSLLTGRYPHAHGAMRDADGFAVSVADMTGLPGPTDAPTVAEALALADYDTYGAFAIVVPFLALRGRFGTHALYDDAPAEPVLADHRAWLADRRDRRTFSYLHLGDLHEPVDPPEAYWRAHGVPAIDGIRRWRHQAVVEPTPTVERYRRHRRRLYRAAVEYVDNRLGAHHRRLSDLLGDLLFVVVADHGEALWERTAYHAATFADPRPAYGVGHGAVPHEAVARVPLRVDGLRVDGVDAAVGETATSLVDVAPTLAEAAGIEFDGHDGAPLGRDAGDRVLLCEGTRYGYEKKAAYARDGDDAWKLLASRGDDVEAFFRLPGPDRRTPPAAVERRLREALPPWPDEKPTGSAPSRDVRRRLAALGYR